MRRLLAMLVLMGSNVHVAAEQVRDDFHCQPTLAPRASGGREAQVPDLSFNSEVRAPAYAPGSGPRVLLDEAHRNFHTMDGRYAPFVQVLRANGYIVEANREPFTPRALQGARVLVIANASSPATGNASFIPSRSAFTTDEITAVKKWVADGGSLLLIADHMPWGGAMARLAETFGLLFTNAYATDETCSADEFVFQAQDQSLRDHAITRGRSASERVTTVTTITGQAFRAIDEVKISPLLVLNPRTVLLLPTAPWKFTSETPRVPAQGMFQGAVLTHGRGRVAAFGEAAMFSAQVSGAERRPMGMNQPSASQNKQFLLNVMHWLDGTLPER